MEDPAHQKYLRLKGRAFYGAPQQEPHSIRSVDVGYGVVDRAIWLCDICGRSTSLPLCVGQDIGADIVLCSDCAEAIGERYHHRCTGRFVAWNENAPSDETDNGRSNKRKSISATNRRKVHERDAYRCRYCEGYDDLCIDHLEPVSKGGGNRMSNLVTACRSCNSAKGPRTPAGAKMKLLPISQDNEVT